MTDILPTSITTAGRSQSSSSSGFLLSESGRLDELTPPFWKGEGVMM